jgi:hypothetical protein
VGLTAELPANFEGLKTRLIQSWRLEADQFTAFWDLAADKNLWPKR